MIGLRVSKPTITLLNATNKELIVFVSPNPNQLHLRKKKVVNKMEASAGQTGVANAMAGSTMEHEYEAPVAENKTLKYVMSPTGHKKKISVERDVYLTVVQYKPDEGKFLFIQEERFHRKLNTYTINQEHLEHHRPRCLQVHPQDAAVLQRNTCRRWRLIISAKERSWPEPVPGPEAVTKYAKCLYRSSRLQVPLVSNIMNT